MIDELYDGTTIIQISDAVMQDETVKKNTQQKVKKSNSKAKPKVTITWPCDDVRLLISSVELHPSIWDFACADHKNLVKREAAWNEVISVFDNRYGVAECKAKWSNIKTAYQKVKSKMLATKSGQGAASINPHWPYWAEMQFVTRGESAHNMISVSNLSFDMSPINEDTESSSNTQFQRSAETSTFHAMNDGSAKHKRKQSSNSLQAQSLTTDAMVRAMKALENDDDDEWQTIGNYLAAQLRNIAAKNREKAERIHRKMVKTVLDAYDELDNTNLQNQLSAYENMQLVVNSVMERQNESAAID